MPLVYHVFIAVAVMVYLVAIMVVAVMVCGRCGIGLGSPRCCAVYVRMELVFKWFCCRCRKT